MSSSAPGKFSSFLTPPSFSIHFHLLTDYRPYEYRAYGAAIGRAYFVTSTFQTLRLRLAEKAVIPSLLALLAAETNERSVKIACLGALQYMSLVDKAGKYTSFPIQSYLQSWANFCNTLTLLTMTDVFFKNIGIVQSLSDSLGIKGDAMAGQYSAAILYNISLHEVLCRDLYEDGATVLLINLAKVRLPCLEIP